MIADTQFPLIDFYVLYSLPFQSNGNKKTRLEVLQMRSVQRMCAWAITEYAVPHISANFSVVALKLLYFSQN